MKDERISPCSRAALPDRSSRIAANPPRTHLFASDGSLQGPRSLDEWRTHPKN